MRDACKDFGGICTICEESMKTCQCDPCQHGRTRQEECVFCEREEEF
jgi:hypothetical protein